MHRGFHLFACAALVAACSQTPTDLREWRPGDHDHTENPSPAQVDMTDGGSQGVMGVDEVALAAWKSNCIVCHGLIGRGDGPKGPSVKAKDLTDPAFQASRTDEQLLDSILHGKGQMPKADIPESTARSLVKLVRLLNRARAESAGDDAGSSPDAALAGDAGKSPRDGGARVDAARPRPAPAADAGAKP